MVVRRTPLRSLVLTGATLGVLLGVAACTGPGPLARTGDARGDDLMVVVQTPPDEPQGVYYLQHQRVFVHLDPQRDADADTQAFARTFLQRSLAGLQYAVPGNVAGVVPDLALALGRHDPRSTTWTYTLRRGVRFEDGSPVGACASRPVPGGGRARSGRESRSCSPLRCDPAGWSRFAPSSPCRGTIRAPTRRTRRSGRRSSEPARCPPTG